MNYEQLLEQAYEKVKPVSESERFEILKVCGHHEGTKTIISNFCQIASSLCRPQEHLMKFLNKELASSSEICGDRLILSRRLPSRTINEKIQKYANAFVFCCKCKKPDTELIKEGQKTFMKCMACGTKNEVHKI